MSDLNATVLALQIDQGTKFINVQFHRENSDFDREGSIGRSFQGDGWSEKTYTYKVEPGIHDNLQIGSLVVVRARNHMQVVRVAELDVDVDFGDRKLVRLLRWALADVSADLERVEALEKAEVKAKRDITNARLRRESKQLLDEAGLEEAPKLLNFEVADEAVDGSAG